MFFSNKIYRATEFEFDLFLVAMTFGEKTQKDRNHMVGSKM